MKKLSARVARLTPSITIGLILFAVGLTALLAYRAYDASRAQQQTTEHTLREYAGFAAFQLKNATITRIAVQHRIAVDLVPRVINTRGQTPALDSKGVAELIETRGRQCRCLDGVSFYYQVTFADSSIETTASELATPENIRRIRDTVIAHAAASIRGEAITPGAPIGMQNFVAAFTRVDGHPYVFMHTVAVDSTGAPRVAYGYAVKTERLVGSVVESVLRTQPVLPTTLTLGLRVDSILSVKVSEPSGEIIYESGAPIADRYSSTDTLDTRLGSLRFEVAINPAFAGRLIIGGLPSSRLPEVIATAFLAMSLLGLLLYQFRRQEELGRLRDDFVSGVSHELRTPLAQIRLLAELLRLGKVPTEEQKERSLRIIDKEARRLSFLVDSILNFTHAERGQLSRVSTNIATEIEEIVSGFEPLAEANGVQLITQLDREIVAAVDRGALRQILLNLLDNAVRYGPSQQRVTIATTLTGDTWALEVTDEGPGIPPSESERIFDPYYRMSRDAGGAVGGTGIGLAVVQRLVTEHGGRVYVAPARGDNSIGAHFVVSLPVNITNANTR